MTERALPGNRRSLVTPEGVDLSLRLAEPGDRLAAFLLDLMIMLGTLIAITLVLVLGVFTIGTAGLQLAVITWLLGFFLLRNGYFIMLEMGPRAATFGKRMVGLRVVSRDGGRLTADAVIARNLLRELEFYLPLSLLAYQTAGGSAETASVVFALMWALIFVFFPFFNRDRLRVGDLLAGTWIIKVPRRRLGLDLLSQAPERAAHEFTPEQLDVYGVLELQTLEAVLRGGDPTALATVADRIRAKTGARQAGTDEEFLRAYYEALRLKLERELLLGRRRSDKHDRSGGTGQGRSM